MRTCCFLQEILSEIFCFFSINKFNSPSDEKQLYQIRGKFDILYIELYPKKMKFVFF